MKLMCRHTVGLNYTAIGIEHIGRSDADILDNPRQLRASLRLTTWLRCRFEIGTDWTHASMKRYRAKLRKQRCS